MKVDWSVARVFCAFLGGGGGGGGFCVVAWSLHKLIILSFYNINLF